MTKYAQQALIELLNTDPGKRMLEYEKIKRAEKCPKCNGHIKFFTEEWPGYMIVFLADRYGFPEKDGASSKCDPLRVRATCSECDYKWTIKDIKRASELHQRIEELEDGRK